MATVKGLWIIIKAVGAINTEVPAMAITLAAEAAMPQGAKAVTNQLLAGAQTTHENAFKLPLVERTLASVLLQARS